MDGYTSANAITDRKPDKTKVTYFGIPSAASFDHPFLPWDSAPFASCLGDAWRELLSAKARLVGLGDFLYKQKDGIVKGFDINSTRKYLIHK